MDHQEGGDSGDNNTCIKNTTKSRLNQEKDEKNDTLSILCVNCQSVKAKKQQLHVLINTRKPDIIIGTESWLKPSDSDDECAPKNLYEVFRKDRVNKKGGGVFLAVSRTLCMQEVQELDADCEIIWCKVRLANLKTLFVASYYRPHEDDEHSLNELHRSLSKLTEKDHLALIVGDFNLPGWNGKNNTINLGRCNYPRLHHKFADILTEQGYEQMVEEPTRHAATLDLVLTNNPTRVSGVEVVPGISDHDAVVISLNTAIFRHKQTRRQIPLYKKAKWPEFKEAMT